MQGRLQTMGLAVSDLIFWVLTVYGVTLIVTESKIFSTLRGLLGARDGSDPATWSWPGRLVSCAMCFGWWVGAMMAILGAPAMRIAAPWMPEILRHAAEIVLSGAASSAVCWLLRVHVERVFVGNNAGPLDLLLATIREVVGASPCRCHCCGTSDPLPGIVSALFVTTWDIARA